MPKVRGMRKTGKARACGVRNRMVHFYHAVCDEELRKYRLLARLTSRTRRRTGCRSGRSALENAHMSRGNAECSCPGNAKHQQVAVFDRAALASCRHFNVRAGQGFVLVQRKNLAPGTRRSANHASRKTRRLPAGRRRIPAASSYTVTAVSDNTGSERIHSMT